MTAGLRWAPDSGPEMYTAVMTAKPHPKAMASQPALRALEAFRGHGGADAAAEQDE